MCKHDLQKGHIISEEDLDYLRPCPPRAYHPFEKDLVLGKTLNTNKSEKESILKEDLC